VLEIISRVGEKPARGNKFEEGIVGVKTEKEGNGKSHEK
jgi:hypothetical protein